jgi:tRNA threonylcarbamoyladenosine biosynthesis protein TsaB
VKPLILALDTTHEFGSLCLCRGGELMEEVLLHAPTGFAHVLYRALGELLERYGVKAKDVDCFAAASGPGSFTGVRVGLACIKGLAEAAGKPAVAVSNLQALAAFGGAPLRAAVLDARRGEVYGAAYDAQGALAIPESAGPLEALLERLPDRQLDFVTGDVDLALAGTRFEKARVVRAPRAIAAAVARLALESYCRGQAADPAALDANYVRRSDAELFWRE